MAENLNMHYTSDHCCLYRIVFLNLCRH